MYTLSSRQMNFISGGISDGDSGNGVGYYATPSQIESGVKAEIQSGVDFCNDAYDFAAGFWAGL